MSAAPRIGVSASRFRKPVWMSRARSVPAFIVAKSAPWMNGKARKNARNESDGKPGRRVAELRPADVTASSAAGKRKGRNRARGLAQSPDDRALRDLPDLYRERTHSSTSCYGLLLRALQRPAGLREEDVVEARRVQVQVGDAGSLGVEGTHDLGEVVDAAGKAHGHALRRAVGPLAEPLEDLRDRRGVGAVCGDRLHRRPVDLRLQVLGRPLRDDPAVVDDPDPVGERVSLLEVLGRQEDRDALLAGEPRDLQPERASALRVEPRGRLVEKEDRRAVGEGQRKVEAPLHPAGIALDLPVRGQRQADALEQLGRAGLPLAARRSRAARTGDGGARDR